MTSRLCRACRSAHLHAYGWAARRLYDELAWAYDPLSRFISAGRWVVWRSFALDYVAGPRVLELGFGTGELLIAVRRQGLSVIGLDSSRAMHRVTARKLARAGMNVPHVRASAEQLPFAAGSFDTVLSTFPTGYILEPATLREIARVLAPTGRLVIGGLIVQLPRSLRYPLSVVPNGSWEVLWTYVQTASAAAGLQCTLVWREDGPTRVPVVVCTRCEGGAAE